MIKCPENSDTDTRKRLIIIIIGNWQTLKYVTVKFVFYPYYRCSYRTVIYYCPSFILFEFVLQIILILLIINNYYYYIRYTYFNPEFFLFSNRGYEFKHL